MVKGVQGPEEMDGVRCPRCGGPGKVERDWRGDERVVCDAYERCDEDAVGCPGPRPEREQHQPGA